MNFVLVAGQVWDCPGVSRVLILFLVDLSIGIPVKIICFEVLIHLISIIFLHKHGHTSKQIAWCCPVESDSSQLLSTVTNHTIVLVTKVFALLLVKMLVIVGSPRVCLKARQCSVHILEDGVVRNLVSDLSWNSIGVKVHIIGLAGSSA